MRPAPTAELVRDLLTHLNDSAYLLAHPLAALVDGKPPGDVPQALRGLVAEAMEQLRPVGPSTEASWRGYRFLVQRYFEGESPERAARALGVSVRQAMRDQHHALDALAVLLDRAAARSADPSGRWRAAPLIEGADGHDELGEAASAAVKDVVEGALEVVRPFAAARGVRFATQDLELVSAVAVGPALLRQALLHLLAYAAAVAPTPSLLVVGADEPSGVVLRVVAAPGGSANGGGAVPRPETDPDELLRAGRQILEQRSCPVEAGPRGGPGPLVTCVLPPVELSTVLVVDDNPDVVGLFRRYLRGQPYRLVQAVSGEGAIRAAARLRPDLVTLDVPMPSEDGWTTFHRLRADPATRAIPIVVCSVLPERALAVALGADGFLAKPVTPAGLEAALARHCPARAR